MTEEITTFEKIVDITYVCLCSAFIPALIAIGLLAGPSHKEMERERARLYQESLTPVVATVLEESYQNTLSKVPEYDGWVSHSNETVKLESKYTLKCKRDDNGKIIAVSVVDGESVKKESIDRLVNKGSRISFPAGNHYQQSIPLREFYHPDETYFKEGTCAGTKRADRITVLNK
ncbi:hypothetical protein KY332_02565 [Candidatus Woesearchaeota archaeon]|nr:hypothetical protein [Candidatus Woesearchaeota archaeon]